MDEPRSPVNANDGISVDLMTQIKLIGADEVASVIHVEDRVLVFTRRGAVYRLFAGQLCEGLSFTEARDVASRRGQSARER